MSQPSKKRRIEDARARTCFFGPLSRVKLCEEILTEFLIGNTFARSLISEKDVAAIAGGDIGEDDLVHLLWVGVGDVRNPLLTLSGLSSTRRHALHLNDVSPVTLARDAVILAMGASRIDDAIAVWSDSMLDTKTHGRLQETLQSLIDNKYDFMDFSAASRLQTYWRSWLTHSHSLDTLGAVRREALAVKGAGHQRVGVSESWRRLGIASKAGGMAMARACPNPTLYDLTNKDVPKYLELQGPGAAFANLVGDIGTEEFATSLAKAWTSLFKSWQERIATKRVVAHFYLGDCAAFLQRPDFACKFAAIDTSNVMDYTGMWNLVLQSEPCLVKAKGAYVFVEQILGVSSSVDDMLAEKFPYEGSISKDLATAMALEIVPLPVADGREKVVHAIFRRCEVLGAKVDFDQILKRILNFCMPIPMTAAMLEDGKLAIDLSYRWPLSTVATFVRMLSKMSLSPSAFISNVLSSPMGKHARNRSLALRIQCSLCGSAFMGVKSLYTLSALRIFDVKMEPLEGSHFFLKRGGVFEPALAVMLVRNSKALRAATEKSGKWFIDPDYSQPVNALHEWVGERSGKTIQFIQNLRVKRDTAGSLIVSVVLPITSEDSEAVRETDDGPLLPPIAAFRQMVLVDVQSFEIVSKPVILSMHVFD